MYKHLESRLIDKKFNHKPFKPMVWKLAYPKIFGTLTNADIIVDLE
jgi:hypothetical protein